MDRNTIIAIVLSVIVITVGMTIQTMFFAPEIPVDAGVVEETIEADVYLPESASGSIIATGDTPDSAPFDVTAGEYTITFNPEGASISSIRLNNHDDNGKPVELLFKDADDANAFMMYSGKGLSEPIDDVFAYSIAEHSTLPLTIVTFTRSFRTSDSDTDFIIEKRFAIPQNEEYMFQISVSFKDENGNRITPINDEGVAYTLAFGPQIGPAFESMSNNYDYRRVSLRYDDENRRDARFSDGIFTSDEEKTLDWISLSGKYFAFILIPDDDVTIASSGAIQYTNETGVPQEDIVYIERAATASDSSDIYSFYAGPKVKRNLTIFESGESVFSVDGHDMKDIIDGNWLSWLENILNWLLQLFHRIIPNYGISIILLTILIKLLLQPLAKRGMDSTAKMSALGPKINEIKERYPDDPEAQNAAMAKLYKEEKINPMGSCLPMLIQFPIFIALYGLLNTNFDLRGSMFIPGWIPDLSIPDTIFTLPFAIPFLGSQIHLLPILYTISMIFSMKITQSGSQAGSQQGMMTFMTYGMPIIFFFIMYNAPSGLLLYWSTVNVISIGQQLFVNKKKKAVYEEEIAEKDAIKQAKKDAKRKNRRK